MRAPVRIGLDARYAFRSNRRGIGEYVAALIAHLPMVCDESDRFVLFVDRQAELDTVDISDERLDVRPLPTANPLMWEEVALPRAVRSAQIDLLHLTSNYGPTRISCPTIYTVHDTIEFVRTSFGRPNLSWRHALGRNVRVRTLPVQARRARAIITVSEASKRDIEHWLGVSPERIRVIPLAVSDDFRPADDLMALRPLLAQAGFDPDARYVLALGALDPRKNGATLIRAFQRVQALQPAYELRIIGIERPEAYPVPLEPTPPWLRLLGFVPRPTLVALLQAATVFVYPSLYEGFGLPPIQAMACGVPVIVSDNAALTEVIGEAAIRFPATEPEALADALLRLLGDAGERACLTRAGLERATRFSWHETAKATYAAYGAALSPRQDTAA